MSGARGGQDLLLAGDLEPHPVVELVQDEHADCWDSGEHGREAVLQGLHERRPPEVLPRASEGAARGAGAGSARKRKELGFPRFLVLVSANLHKGLPVPPGAASEDGPWTATQIAHATVHLTSQFLKFSMEQQLYVARHLDCIVMVLGDGAMPGSMGLPYWCDICLRLPVAIG